MVIWIVIATILKISVGVALLYIFCDFYIPCLLLAICMFVFESSCFEMTCVGLSEIVIWLYWIETVSVSNIFG